MITEIQDGIIDLLQAVSGVKTVDVWQGDIDELLRSPQNMPALQLVYQGCGFEKKKVIGANLAPHGMTFLIVLIHKNLRSRRACAEECNTVIEAVRTQLIGTQISTYGWLWPVKEELLFAESGMLAYGLEYMIATET